MNNQIGPEFLLTAEDPKQAALFYINQLGFEVTEVTPARISLNGRGLNLAIEPGPASAPILLLTDPHPDNLARSLLANGCQSLGLSAGDQPETASATLTDPFGLHLRILPGPA